MVTQSRIHGSRNWMLAALATLVVACVALAAQPGTAHASEGKYCYGTWLQNHNDFCSTGYEVQNTYLLFGVGNQHSVCVWDAAGRTECSPGAGQGVYNESMSGCGTGCGIPTINNNGYSANQVYARYYY